MKISDEPISTRMRNLRISVGGRARDDYLPSPPPVSIDVKLEGRQIEALFHSSGLLVHRELPVFAYIRDHTFWVHKPPFETEKLNRVHFAVCQTLVHMQQVGKLKSRYRSTNSTSNKYLIDVRVRGKTTELQARLHPCQHCLALLAYKGFEYTESTESKMSSVRSFDADQAQKELWHALQEHREELKKLPVATIGTGYPPNWRLLSYLFRKRYRFKCAVCRVVGSSITDTHHINGDKSDFQDTNLQCLCKLCHLDIHPHYKVLVTIKEKESVLQKRNEQGILVAQNGSFASST